MIVIDDIILASVIALVLLVISSIIIPLMCFLGIMLCGIESDELYMTGGAKKLKKAIKKVKSNIDLLISYTNANIEIDPVERLIEKYGFTKPDQEEINRQLNYLEQARKIYRKEHDGDDRDLYEPICFNLERYLGYLKSNTIIKVINKDPTFDINKIKKTMVKRILTEDYPTTNISPMTNFGIKNIEFDPYDKRKFEEYMDKLFVYSIINTARELNNTEEKEVENLINDLNSAKLTKKRMTVNFVNRSSIQTYSCYAKHLNAPYTDTYKKLHWGQRKLLLSEIDFLNRTAQDMGFNKFRKQTISVVYPGSAHGHKLMIQMEMFPNIVYYLWDPAKYNTILYIADFLRRGLSINFNHTDQEMEIAKKFVGRIFINMELPNDTYLEYHNNATTGNIHKNYGTEWGFFVKKSADFYLKYKKDQNDESPTLFISDIRLFTRSDAVNSIMFNHIKNYNDIVALQISAEAVKFINYTRDMQLQLDWYKMVNATYGLFKFKLKEKDFRIYKQQSEYLDGDIIIQAWAPITSTETRLFVAPKHKEKAYYNINKYTDKLKAFNSIMRVTLMGDVKLSELGMPFKYNKDLTVGDIWRTFLPDNLIGQDCILELYILYDYLEIFKGIENIRHTDLMLMISDFTQTLINRSDYSNILGYLNNGDVKSILSSRTKYHETFKRRLDYNSARTDKVICDIYYNNKKGYVKAH